MIAVEKKIWIDIDNTPHVPFFRPIMSELGRRGYSVVLTARDCFQVCGLADYYGLGYRRIGRHYGKYKPIKVGGLLIRALQLIPIAIREKPSLALSHGSRAQLIVANLLGIPSILISDYEFARGLPMVKADWIIVPEVIPNQSVKFGGKRLLHYPGIKEDVYVSDFKPDPRIRKILGINEHDILVTIRPPSSEAHYRNPESEKLFADTVESLASQENVKMVMLPRNERQARHIRVQWPKLCANGKIVIPREVVDGLNLMWHSDIVVSGGGTMNREAAALGVPVYSIFRGKTGAVDRYLADKGRLILIANAEDVKSKIHPVRRTKEKENSVSNRLALGRIVSLIEEVAK